MISDFIGTGDWERPLIRLAHRNEVVALRVVDGADDALPEVGLIVVEDAETGEQLLVDSGDPWFRARFRDGVDEREAELRAGMRRAGVPLHRVDTDSDLVETLLAIVAETRRRRAMTLSHPLLLVARPAAWPPRWPSASSCSSRRRSAALAGGRDRARRRGAAGRSGCGSSLAGVVVLAVAVAGPAASLPVGRSAGTVILAMDVSNSMSADDVAPTRLAAAQQAAPAFIDAQPDTVDIGVVGFDQGALTTVAARRGPAAAKAAVENLRTSGGTSLASAILGSLSAITGKTVTIGEDGELPDLGYWGSATIVLFSDGEDSGGGGGDAVDRGRDRRPERRRPHRDRRRRHGRRHHRRGRRLPAAHRAGHRAADHHRPDHRRQLPPGLRRRAARRRGVRPSTCG